MTFRSVGIALVKGVIRATIWAGFVILAGMLLGIDPSWRILALLIISDFVNSIVYGAVK